jgi:thiamine pyrophosphate-dependent acetolactate synthase large subunit-like protein
VDFSTETDYGAIARAFGFKSARIADPAALEGAIHTAFADGGPYFLDVLTAPPMIETPPVVAWEMAAASRPSGDD